MRTRLLALAAAGGIAVAALPAHAATAPKPQITDPTGDANGVNDQGSGLGGPTAAGPADDSSADITSVLFQSTFAKKVTTKVRHHKRVKIVKKVPTGFTVTMTLAGAPGPETEYRVVAATTDCSDIFFEYGTDAATGGSDVRCPATPPATEVDYKAPVATVKGTTITWTLPIAIFPVGTTFTGLSAQTRLNPVVVTAPQMDGAAAPSGTTFTVGK